MTTVVRLAFAYHFAAIKHTNQRRKGGAAEPYINHLAEVAALVAEATNGGDIELVIAAVLHDAVEDTDTNFEELWSCFGPRVTALIDEVTDDKSLPKAERKRLQIEHAAAASPGAKIIKLADKTSNLRSLVSSPPPDWSPERRQDYVRWARDVAYGCRGASAELERQFDLAAISLEQLDP